MRALLAMLVLAGCGGGALSAADGGPIEVRTWLEGEPGANGGMLVVQTAFPAGADVQLPIPQVERLRLQPVDEPVVERIGRREVVTQQYRFTGPKGSYVVPALDAIWTPEDGGEPVTASSSPLYVDLGVDPPRDGELADISDPGAVWTVPWGAVGAVGGVGGLLAAGLWLALRGVRHRPEVALPPEPPDVIAIRRWEAARQDPALDDEGKAVAISLIFREYAEEVLGFPASKWTTTEIVERLRGLVHLPEGNVPRARRLLRATDRVKYADAAATADLFEELDADLRAFIGSTRPHPLADAAPPEGS